MTGTHSILLDSEALSLVAQDDPRMQAWKVLAHRTDSVLFASAATLAETTDGSGRDANVRRAASFVRFVPVTTEIGFLAGRLRSAAARGRRKHRDLTLDTLVAATALGLPGPTVVVTSDASDLALLTAGTKVKVIAV